MVSRSPYFHPALSFGWGDLLNRRRCIPVSRRLPCWVRVALVVGDGNNVVIMAAAFLIIALFAVIAVDEKINGK